MKHYLKLLTLWGVFAACSGGYATPFSQDFNGPTLNPGWTLQSPNPASTNLLTGTNFQLTAAWTNGGSDLYSSSDYNAPRLLQPVDPTSDWTIETKVDMPLNNNYAGAGLLLAKTEGVFTAMTDFSRIAERGFNQAVVALGTAVPDSAVTAFLRVQKAGATYTGSWSLDGTNWNLNGIVTDTTQWPYFGIFAIRQPWDGVQADLTASFYYFHVTVNPPLANTYTWVGAVSSDWFNTNNWYPQGVPGASDTAIINSGTAVLNAAANVGYLTLNGGSLNAGPALTVAHAWNWTGGSIAGAVTISSGATATFNALLNHTLDMAGCSLANNGSALWLTGQIRGGSSGTFSNNASWLIQTDNQIGNDFGGSFTFYNNGTVTKSVTTGTTRFAGVSFNNSGTVNVQTGLISAGYGGVFAGAINVNTNAALDVPNGGLFNGVVTTAAGGVTTLSGGTFTYGPDVVFAGGGENAFTGGAITLTNDSIPNLQMLGGTLSLSSTFQNAGVITNLTLNGDTLSGNYAVSGVLNWAAGGLSGGLYISNGATLHLNGSSQLYQTAAVTNAGHILWDGSSNWRLQNDNGLAHGTIWNLAGGVFDILCSQQIQNYYNNEYMVNYGLVRKSQDPGTTIIGVQFNNTGTVSLLAGAINFQYGSFSGSFSAANGTAFNFQNGGVLDATISAGFGAAVNFTGGTFTQTPNFALTGAGMFQQTGGTLTLLNNTIPNLQLNGGTVALAPTFQNGVISSLTLNNQALSGSNVVVGTLTLNNCTVTGPLYVALGAVVNWTSGQMSGPVTIANGGTLNVSAPGAHGFLAAVTNSGAVNWTGGELRLFYNNGFYNLASGVLNIQCDASWDAYYGGEYFNNYGQVVKSGTLGNTPFYPIFNNFGAVNVNGGAISFGNNDAGQLLGGTFNAASGAAVVFNGGGVLQGTYNAAPGGEFLLAGGTFTNTPTTLFSGAGANIMTGGALTLISNLIPNLQITGGTVAESAVFQGGSITNLTLQANLAGSNYITGVLNLTGAINGPLTVASNATLSWSGDVNAPLVAMPGAILNWGGGNMNTAFTVPTNAVLNILSGSHGFTAPATNAGIVNWKSGEVRLFFNNGFYNLAGAALNILCDQTWDAYYGGEFVFNAGVITKTGTTGNTAIYPLIVNTSLVNINSGSISFNNNDAADQVFGGTFNVASGAALGINGGGSLTGAYVVAAGGQGYVTAGTFANAGSAVFTGPGSTVMTGGTLTLASNLIPNLSITGGTVVLGPYFQGGSITNLTLQANLAGSNYVSAGGVLNLTGNINGPLTLASNTVLNWAGDVNATVAISPTATLNWTGGVVYVPLTIPSHAILNLVTGNAHGFATAITNAGAVNWLAGEARIFFNNQFYNLAGGVFTIACDQNFDSYYGSETFVNSGLMQKAGTSGTTQFYPIFNNSGTLDVESGTINFNAGAPTQNSGVWSFAVNSAGAVGHIGCAGTVPLNGALELHLNNYVPGLSNVFTPVTYNNFSGAFAATNLPGAGALWQLTYGANAVSIALTNLHAPTVVLNSPTNGQVLILPGGVPFSATPSDSFAAITRVQFLQGTNVVGQAAGSPYNFTWSSVTPGYYTVSALVTDANGALGTSAPVSISVFANAYHATNFTWNGAVSSDWFTAGNWTPSGVPGVLDTVAIGSGTVNLSGPATVSTVNMTSGTLQGPGVLTVTNQFAWTGGNLAIGLTIGSNATFACAGGNLGGLRLNNYGTVAWTGPTLSGSSGTAVTNFGLFVIQTDAGVSFNSAAPFVNNGIVRKLAYGQTTAFYGMTFTNNGVVDSESGTISIQSSGTLSGTYQAGAGAAVTFSGAAFTLDQTPAFTGLGGFYFQNGTMTLLHDAPSALNLTGGTVLLGPSFQNARAITNLTLAGSTLYGTNSVSGVMNWTAGSIAGQFTIAASGVLNLTSGNGKSLSQCTLINAGQVNWSQGSIGGDGGTAVTNNGLWLTMTDDSISFGNGVSSFVNNGTFRKTAYGGVTTIQNLLFSNFGLLDAESGSININSGGVLSGAYNAAANAVVRFNNGAFTLGALPSVTGAGFVGFTGGNLSVLTNLPSNFQLAGGTVTLGPAFNNGGVITNLTLSGATLYGTYSVAGTMNFLSGGISGALTIQTNAVLYMASGNHNFYGSSFTNDGVVYWAGGPIYGNGFAVFDNEGLWLAQSDDQMNLNGVFVNNGTYRKQGTAGTSYFYALPFNNNGLVDVQTGVISLQGGGSLAGTYNAAQFAALYLAAGNFTSAANPVFTGIGGGYFTGGNLTLAYDQIPSLPLVGGNVLLAPTFQNAGAITNLTLSGSTLLGSNTVTGSLNWLAGGLNNSQLIIASNGTVNILSGADKNLPGSTVVNHGTVLWNAGRLRGNSGTFITNNNLWLAQGDYALNNDYGGSPQFFNTGLFEKTGTSGATTFINFSMLNSGAMSILSGAVNFINSSVYAQTAATLSFGVSAPNLGGRLNLNGNLNIDGVLQVQLLNGYAPAALDQFTPITYPSRAGSFASLDLPGLGGGLSWNLDYSASSVILQVLPPPSTNNTYAIAGTVTDNLSHPIAGLRVYATPAAGSVSNLVQNGDFESPSIGSTAYVVYGYGATNVTGWTVTGRTNSNIALTSYAWNGSAEDGFQFMDPSGTTGGGAVSQNLSTVPGSSYVLIFFHGTATVRSINNTLGVTIGTNSYSYGETSGGYGFFDWRRVEIPFTATSNLTTLTFSELTGINTDDGFVDNVQVVSSDYYNSVLETTTDASGHYQINAPNGTFQVGVSGLAAAGYQNVASQSAVVANAGATANFVLTPLANAQFFTVTAAANPSAAGTALGGGSFLAGASVTVTATVTNALPYQFVNWTENGVALSGSASYSFTALRDQHLTANFILPVELLTATVNPNNAGSVLGTGSFVYGTTNNLTASANFGYQFDHWSDPNGDVLGASATLPVVALSNGVYIANYAGTNLTHQVTTGTLPLGLATVAGAGLYTNTQTAHIAAPAFVTNGLTYYAFSQFLLNGNAFSNTPTIDWTFSTVDAGHLALTAVYAARSVRPLVVAAQGNISNPVKATANFVLTVQFDRAMRASSLPLVVLTNAAAATQPTVPPGGLWSTNAYPNDTYTTPPITFAHGMDGTNFTLISQAVDLNGDAVAATNVLSVVVDATPPVISQVAVTPGTISATVNWTTDEPATSQVDFGTTSAYVATTGLNGQLLTSHSVTLTGLNPLTAFHYQVRSRDLAGNETFRPDAVFTTIAAPDLAVTNLTISAGLASGGAATISWVDTNSGSGPTFTGWYDRITVSNLTTHQTLLSANVVYDPSVSGNIVGGASQPRAYPWHLPDGANGAGALQISVTANVYSNQFELTTDNNSAVISAASSLSAYPDLQVAGAALSPASPQSGATVTVRWTDTNSGTKAVSGSFSDFVIVTNLTTSSIIYQGAVYYDASGSGPIGISQGAARQVSFALPNGVAGAGLLGIGITADYYNEVFEYNGGGTGENNNNSAFTALSTLAAYADLAVTNVLSPVSAGAGQTIAVSWTDTNMGNAAATNAWTDQVFISSAPTIGGGQLLTSVAVTNLIAPGQSLAITQMVTLPPFIAGQQWIIVKANASGSFYELNTVNNSVAAAQPLTIGATLAFTLSSPTVSEAAGANAVTGTLSRNGATTTALSVTLGSSNGTNVLLPATVTIPPGQNSANFTIGVVNHFIAGGSTAETISASAAGFPTATAPLQINNDVVAALVLNLSTNQAPENAPAGSVTGAMTRNANFGQALTVTLTSDNPAALAVPASVVILAGQSSASFSPTFVNDNVVGDTRVVHLTASAAAFSASSTAFNVLNANIAQLALQFSTATVSKGAASPATVGTVTRSPVLSSAQNVLITSVNNPLVSAAPVVTIPANAASASFNVNVGDDNLATGTQTANVLAQVMTPAGLTLAAGQASASLTILDTHGPSLSVSFSPPTVAKGSATTCTVTRNTPPTNALTVNLAASLPSAVTMPASVVLAQNQSSASFAVNAVADNISSGPRKVTVTASLTGYNSGASDVTISDIYYPDLVTLSVTAPTNAATSQQITVTWVVANHGLAATTNNWLDYVYLVSDTLGDNQQFVSFNTNTAPLAIGASYTNQTTFYLPPTPGNYFLEVMADGGTAVTELSKQNNVAISAVPVAVNPSYRATITNINPTVSPQGTPIVLSGRTYDPNTGLPVASSQATVRILINGTRRAFPVSSDVNGNFSYVFQPLANEAGDYQAGADYPLVSADTVQGAFSILGMQVTPQQIVAQLLPNTLYTGQLTLSNLTDYALSGLTVATANLGSSFTAQFTLTNQNLPANGAMTVNYSFLSTLTRSAQLKFSAVANSTEGAHVTIPVTLNVVPLVAQLTVNPGYLTGGMLVGGQTVVSFDVINTGGAASGDLAVQLPATFPWMTLSSTSTVPSIPAGSKATVILALNPPPDLPLTLYQGNIALANQSNGVSVPFQYRATSDGRGNLLVTATDEYTYYVAGAPKVTNALVTVRDAITTAIVAQTNADENGLAYFASLPAGPYTVDATATQHNQFRGSATVTTAITNQLEAFMSRQLVTYQWTVVPTEVADQYQIQLESVFETQVPIPNIVIAQPRIMIAVFAGEASQFDISMSNEGLIAANNVTINVPNDPNYIITPLVTNVGVIPAQSTIDVPVTVQLRSAPALNLIKGGAPRKQDAGDCSVSLSPCLPDIPLNVGYDVVCGDSTIHQNRDATLAALCIAKDAADKIKECLEKMKELTGSENLASVGCNAIAAFLSCVGGDLDPCAQAAIAAACGALTGGAAGAAAAGLPGLPACICAHLADLPLPSLPSYTPTEPGGPELLLPILPTGSYFVTGCPVITSIDFGTANCSQTPAGPNTVRRTVGAVLPPHLSAPSKSDTASVCAHIRLEIDQSVVLTHDAFAGTLEIDNGDAVALTDLQVNLNFQDATNGDAASKFVIEGPTLNNLTSVDGSGVIPAGATGSAVYTFIPTLDAAPNAPETFQIGGTLTYTDNGQTVTVPLLSAPITVYPEARLNLSYFQQRDVYGDDPFTPQIEPSEPFALGLIVKNIGAGDAHNFTITSGQPKIIDNQKGLLVNFSITGTEVGDQPISPSLTANLGNIAPGGAKEVTWQMLSTLEGKFVSFQATFQHINDLGNLATSLINEVDIHELTRQVMADRSTDDDVPDFLVNDIPDPDNLPDTLYLSDGSLAPVTVDANASFDGSVGPGHLLVHLTATVTNGWNYLQLPDPGPGYLLDHVVRPNSQALPGSDAWTTDRSFPASSPMPVVENLFHLFDWSDSAGPVMYAVYYHSTNTTPPALVQVGPVTPFTQSSPVTSVSVTFSEPIDVTTFNPSMLVLTRNGGPNLIGSASGITLALASASTYTISGLQAFTPADGNYQLAFNANGLYDLWGNNAGNVSASVSWAQGNAPVVVQSIAAITPNPRNVPVSSAVVTFSKPINPATFNYTALSLTLNGGPNLITSGVTVTAGAGNSFTINGLGSLTGGPGNYALTVNAASVSDNTATAGQGAQTATWSMITTGPTITALEQLATNPRNIVVQSLNVTFSEPIDPATFDFNDVSLSLNGGPNLITSAVTVSAVNPTTFKVANFNWVVGLPGTYTFTVNAAGLADLAGNPGSGSTNESWQMILETPPTPTNLAVSPDTGVSAHDGVTRSNVLVLSGNVAGTNLTIRLTDQTSGLDLGVATNAGTNFAAALAFTTEGQHHLKVVAVDAAGNNSNPAYYDLFLDLTPPGAVIAQVLPNPISSAVTNILVNFSKAMDTSTVKATNFVLTRYGTNTFTPTISFLTSNQCQVSGIAAFTAPLGIYTLTLNLSGAQDLAGNIGSGSAVMSWQNVFNNLLPYFSQLGTSFVQPDSALQLTMSATDPGLHPLYYLLASNAPAGMTLTRKGALTWTPVCAQGTSTNSVTIWAVEQATPALSNSMTFAVVVGDCAEVDIGSGIVLAGAAGSVPMHLLATAGLTNLSFTLNFPTNRLFNLAVVSSNSAIGATSVRSLTATQTIVTVTAKSGQSLLGSSALGSLSFNASLGSSAFIPLTFDALAATETSNVLVAVTQNSAGRVVLLGPEPLLEAQLTNRLRNVLLYGLPGNSYQVQTSGDVRNATNWTDFLRVPMTNYIASLTNLDLSAKQTFYRAYSFQASPPIVDIPVTAGGGVEKFVLYGVPGEAYEIDSSTGLGAPWNLLLRVPLTNAYQVISGLLATNRAVFYRFGVLAADPPVLEGILSNHQSSLLAFGLRGTNYQIQFSTNFAIANSWSALFSYKTTNAFQSFTDGANTNPARFYRIKKQ